MRYLLFFGLVFYFCGNLTAQNRPTVYVFLAEECPISIAMAAPLQDIVIEFGDRLELIAVFPNLKSDAISIRAFLGRHNLEGWQPLLDSKQEIAQRLGASVTPEVVVVADDQIHFRGRISDAYSAPGRARHGSITNELASVCQRLLNGQSIPQPWPEAVGCFITILAPSP